jgi:hypothetical protein
MKYRRGFASKGNSLESLESRQMLSASPQINFADFSSTTGLVTNGYGSAATTVGNHLQLTDGQLHEARSVFYGTKVPIDTFTANFSFQIAPGTVAGSNGLQEADGLTFVIDNGTTADLGGEGSDLGYSNGTFGANSIALAFNTYDSGSFGSVVSFLQSPPSSTGPATGSVDFHSGDVINVTVTYDGTGLFLSVGDATTGGGGYGIGEAINLASVLGGHTAFVGFTGATGADESVQTINSFNFSGTGIAPTITTAAAASSSQVSTATTNLSVAASSNTGGTLSYAWSLLHAPAGAKTPAFSTNSSAAADLTNAEFYQAGTYKFRVTVTDSNGGVAVSDVDVPVVHVATAIKLKPHAMKITQGTTVQFAARVVDQFGHTFSPQPAISYAILAGSGSIDATTGLYTAGDSNGHLLIQASTADLTAVAGETVVA